VPGPSELQRRRQPGHPATDHARALQRVRDGGIQVDGVEEVRPGRKLFGGETVTIEGEKFGVSLGEGDPHSDDKNSDDKNSKS
jgi:hypothetical protein